jgi:glycolate oxidase FAD binding subunit
LTAARVTPDSVDALADAMRVAFERGEAVAFAGGGTECDLGYPAERIDTVVATERLRGEIRHAPDDMTVTVDAGITLAALQGAVRVHRQRLALDPPLPASATIGGLVATNGFGPLRTRYGTLRDLVIGASFVRADGVLVRGGGNVVKNVAGFDLPRLLVGSLGTLGCVATVTFRLHPLPEAERAVAVRCTSAAQVRALHCALVAAQLEPSAVVALRDNDAFDVLVVFEGFAAALEEQAAAALTCASACGEGAALSADGRFWLRHDAARTGGHVRIRVSAPPASLPEIVDRAFGAGPLAGAALAFYPFVGIAFAAIPLDDAEALVAPLEALRARAEGAGGNLVLLAAPLAVRERFDVYGALPPALALMARIKARFDPRRRCNPGRFAGHL